MLQEMVQQNYVFTVVWLSAQVLLFRLPLCKESTPFRRESDTSFEEKMTPVVLYASAIPYGAAGLKTNNHSLRREDTHSQLSRGVEQLRSTM